MVDLAGYGVPLCNRQVRVYRDVHLGVQSMAQPSRPYFRNVLYAGNVACGVPYLLYGLGLHSIQQAGKDGLARLPDDQQDRSRYQEPHDGVGEQVAQPHPYGTEQDGEARPTVRPRVVSVGHKSRATYLPTDPDAEHGHRLVAYEADHGSHSDCPQHPYGLRMDEPLHSLVSGNNSAEEDDEHDEYTSQVLHSAVAEGEAPADAQTGKGEGDPEGYGGSRVSEVVDGVRKQGHAARHQHHYKLQECRHHESHERPLDGPDTALGGGYGGVHGTVGMAVLPVPMGMDVRMFFAAVMLHGRDSTLRSRLFTRVRGMRCPVQR